jgi:tetratricopeptide (TPR) repeat protein
MHPWLVTGVLALAGAAAGEAQGIAARGREAAHDVALEANPRDGEARRERVNRAVEAARQAARQDQNAASAAWFEKAITEAPARRMELLLEFADQLTYSGKAEQAVPLYREALANRSDRRQGRLGLALALAWSGQFEASLQEYDAMLAADPADTEARWQRSQRLVEAARDAARRDRNAESAALFQRAITDLPARREELLRELADQMTYSGKALEAVALYRETLARQPERKARLGLALALAWTGDSAASLKEYDELLAADPGDAEARQQRLRRLVEAARQAAQRDRNAESAALFDRAITEAPALRMELLTELAEQMTYSGKAAQAVALCREVLAERPDRKARLGLALALAWAGDLAASLREYDDLLAADPGDGEARRRRVDALVQAARQAARGDRNAESAALFERAITEEPARRLELVRELADQMTFSGRAAQATPLYREILARGESRPARLGLALALAWSGQFDAALREYDTLLAANPHDAEIGKARVERLIEAAREAARKDRNAESAALFRKALAAAPERRLEWLCELAAQMTYSGEAKAALPLFREALSFGPREDQRRARLGLALALSWTEALTPALREYEALIAAGPNDVEARLGRARALSWMDRLGPARREYEAALELDPGNLEALRGIARVEMWRGRQHAAQRRLSAFLEQHGADKEAGFLLAQSQHWMGRPDRAANTLQSLLDRHPDHASGRQSLEEIEREGRPDTRVDYRTSTQSDHLTISRFSVEQSLRFAAARTTVSLGYRIYHYDPPEGEAGVVVRQPGAGFSSRLSDSLELNGNVYVDQVDPAGGRPGHSAPTFDSWLTFRPDDTWRFDVGCNRSAFDNLKSLTRNITGTFATFSMDVTPTERTVVTTRFNWGRYSDGNRREWGQVDAQRKLWGRPSLFVGARYTAFGFSRNLDNGYFNPNSYHSGAATVHLYGHVRKRLEYDMDGSVGMERADPGGRKPLTAGSARLRYRLSDRLFLEGRYEAFSSRQASSGGFSRQTAEVMLRWIW